MGESSRLIDIFNPLKGDSDTQINILKQKAINSSNKLREMGVTDINDIRAVFNSSDFLALYDPLKVKNLELYGIENTVTEEILVVEVIKNAKTGHSAFQFVNTSNSNGLKRGDLLTIDPDKEGKENQTEFDEDFVQYCVDLVKQGIPNIESVTTPDKIMEALGIKTYEDIVYMAARKDTVEKQISDRVRTIDGKRKFVEDLGADKSKAKDENDNSLDEERDEDGKPVEAEEEQEGMTIEEAAEVLGIEEEVLREAVGGNCDKILGIRKTSDIESLSRQLGGEGLNNASSEVVLLKVAGPGIKSQGIVLNQDGSKAYSPENGNTTLITELVEDGANGENIGNIDDAIKESGAESKKITTIDPTTGKEVVEFAEEGNEKAISGYEQESKALTQKLHEEIQAILDTKNDGVPYSDKLKEISEKLYIAKGTLTHLQEAYGISEQDNLDEIENQAKDTSRNSEKEAIKENVTSAMGVVGEAAVGTVAAAFGKNMFGKEQEDDESNGHDPREKGYGDPRFG